MPKTGDLSLTIGSIGVPDRNFHDFQAQFRGAENQIKVAERVKIAEIRPSRPEAQVVGPAQGLLYRIAYQ